MTLTGGSDQVLTEVKRQAAERGVTPEVYAIQLLRESVAVRRGSRASVAREILARQAARAKVESVQIIRKDRSER